MAKAEFDFDDFMTQSKMVASMGSMAGVAKMLPGMGNMIDNSQLSQVEKRIKRSEAMICSMTKKERANPELLLKDKTARSRLTRITKGSGMSFEEGVAFMSEFQKMRTMISRMSKQAGMGGNPDAADADLEPAYAGGGGGNRNARRAAKKKGKKGGGRGGGMGFGR